MKLDKILRVLVCLALVCCLTIHAMIPKAEASSIGAAATIVKASTVTCNPYIIAGATLIALGVYAGVETGAFETVANNCVDALEAAGTWIKDGAMELLRTEDADGNASYYVDSGLMEDVRSWAYVSEYVYENPVYDSITSYGGSTYFSGRYYSGSALFTVQFISFNYDADTSSGYSVITYLVNGTPGEVMYYGNHPSSISSPVNTKLTIDGEIFYYVHVSSGSRCDNSEISSVIASYPGAILCDWGTWSVSPYVSAYRANSDPYISDLDLTLGCLPSRACDLTDGTSARQWSEDYTDRGLKVYGGGSGNNNNDGKWFWPVVLVAGADLLAMSQADAWAGETPQEFDDYDTKEELKVMDTPEVEFGFGIVLEPDSGDTDDPTQSTEPTTPGGLPDIGGGDNPDPGGDTDGDTGSDTGTESGNQTDYTSWFERIIKGIEELPSKFESWITDCKTAIEELPSKFADWFNSIIEKLSSIWETLKSIPQIILDGLRNILTELFVPQEDYISAKVDALRGEFGFIDSVIATGEFIRDSISGDSGPPVIYVDLGRAPSGNYGSQRVLLTDFSWYAPYKGQVDTVLSAALWAFFGWKVFLNLPSIIGGESGYISDIAFYESGGYYGGRAKEIRSGRSSRSKEKGGKG